MHFYLNKVRLSGHSFLGSVWVLLMLEALNVFPQCEHLTDGSSALLAENCFFKQNNDMQMSVFKKTSLGLMTDYSCHLIVSGFFVNIIEITLLGGGQKSPHQIFNTAEWNTAYQNRSQ